MTRRVDTLLAPEIPGDEWKRDTWDDAEFTEAAVVEKSPRKRRVFKWFVFVAAWLLVIAVLIGGSIGWWYIRQVNPSGDPQQTVSFAVTPTDTLQSVSVRLQDAKVITNARVFRFYVDHKGGLKLTPGNYQLHPRDHMGNLMRVLNTPPAATYRKVTFPEGFTLTQMGKRVERDLPGLSAADFAAATRLPEIRSTLQPPGGTSLEGLLFPDTYQVAGNESAAQIVVRMVALMDRVGRQENIEARAIELSNQIGVPISPYQVIVVASMIEREAKFEVDRGKIARVIYNRLALGMPLGIDATLCYDEPAGTPFGTCKAAPSPYNTYLNAGLPPTPIASPGKASIEAALNPSPNPSLGDPLCQGLAAGTPCEYLYYVVADADGHHVFAVTLDQHNANVAKARDAGLLDQ